MVLMAGTSFVGHRCLCKFCANGKKKRGSSFLKPLSLLAPPAELLVGYKTPVAPVFQHFLKSYWGSKRGKVNGFIGV